MQTELAPGLGVDPTRLLKKCMFPAQTAEPSPPRLSPFPAALLSSVFLWLPSGRPHVCPWGSQNPCVHRAAPSPLSVFTFFPHCSRAQVVLAQ